MNASAKCAVLLSLFVLLMTVSSRDVSAVCTITNSENEFAAGETIIFEVLCTGEEERNRPYVLRIFNSTGGNEYNVTGNTSATADTQHFHVSWNIPLSYENQNGSFANFSALVKRVPVNYSFFDDGPTNRTAAVLTANDASNFTDNIDGVARRTNLTFFGGGIEAGSTLQVKVLTDNPGVPMFLRNAADTLTYATITPNATSVTYVVNLTGFSGNIADLYMYSSAGGGGDNVNFDFINVTGVRGDSHVENVPGRISYFNVTGLATNQLAIVDTVVAYDGDWKFDETNSISAMVQDYAGYMVVGATCLLNIDNADVVDLPYYVLYGAITDSDGRVIFPVSVNFEIYDIASYEFTISCLTTSDSFTTNLENSSISQASGSGVGTFDVSPHVLINEVYLGSGLNETRTQIEDEMCVNVTNDYRQYDASYVVHYQLLCDVPNQDVQLTHVMNTETLGPQEERTFCRPFIFPEAASQGNGYCRIEVGLDAVDAIHDTSGDFSDSSELFYVDPSFTVTVDSRKITNEQFRAIVRMPKDVEGPVRTIVPKEFSDSWNWDKIEGVVAEYNGTNYSAHFTIGKVSPEDALEFSTRQLDFSRTLEVMTDFEGIISSEQNITLYITMVSEASFWNSVRAYLSRIADALEFWTDGVEDRDTVGNYTGVNSSLANAVVNLSSPVKIEYAVNVSGSDRRKDLHFKYDFAPLQNGVEASFVDQNGQLPGYQSHDAYQAVVLESYKVFNLTLAPRLPVGNYTLYETVFEVNGPGDERVVYQSSYGVNVTEELDPGFSGQEIRIDGVVMQALS